MSDDVFELAAQINELEKQRKKLREIIKENNTMNNDLRKTVEDIEDKQHKLTTRILKDLGDWL